MRQHVENGTCPTCHGALELAFAANGRAGGDCGACGTRWRTLEPGIYEPANQWDLRFEAYPGTVDGQPLA